MQQIYLDHYTILVRTMCECVGLCLCLMTSSIVSYYTYVECTNEQRIFDNDVVKAVEV